MYRRLGGVSPLWTPTNWEIVSLRSFVRACVRCTRSGCRAEADEKVDRLPCPLPVLCLAFFLFALSLFPKRIQGLSLGLNAGLGNLGVSVMQSGDDYIDVPHAAEQEQILGPTAEDYARIAEGLCLVCASQVSESYFCSKCLEAKCA